PSADTAPGVPGGAVIGYIWEGGEGNPAFQSVTLPLLGQDQKPYQIFIWNGHSYDFYKEVPPLTTAFFPNETVRKFKILGIDPNFDICPGDRFITGLSFVSSGKFTGRKTTLINNVPSAKCTALVQPGSNAPSR